MMHFDDWNSPQATLHASTQKLVNLRRSNMALTYGETEILYNENGVLVIGRKYFNQMALIVLSKYEGTEQLTIELPEQFREAGYVALKSNGISCTDQSIQVDGKTLGYEVFSK
jgi:glycosidase